MSLSPLFLSFANFLSRTSFPLGFGLGPLFTAPLSEAYGRYPLYFISCLLYLIFFIPTAYGQNIVRSLPPFPPDPQVY